MQALSQRNGRHVPSAQSDGALQNPAYRPADVYHHEGFGPTGRAPRHFAARSRPPGHPALRAPYPAFIAGRSAGSIGQGVHVLSRLLSCIRSTAALAAVAIAVAGCAAANNATSNQGEQPYQTGYGFSSAGTTTSLYEEFFGPSKSAAATTATAAAAPVQSTSAAPQPVQPVTTAGATRQSRPAAAAASPRQVQPTPAEVAQQPAPPKAPAEADVPVAYGLTANGPTTDLYTELFGPKRPSGQ